MFLFLLAAFMALPAKAATFVAFAVVYVTHVGFLDSPAEFARLLGILVPLAVALLAKWQAPDRLKSLLNVALSALAGVISTVVAVDGGWAWDVFFNAWFNAFVMGIAAYYGVLRPTGIAPSLAKSTANLGLGPSSTPRRE